MMARLTRKTSKQKLSLVKGMTAMMKMEKVKLLGLLG